MTRGTVRPKGEHSMMRGADDAMRDAVRDGRHEDVMALAVVGSVAPFAAFPQADIAAQKLREGREQAAGKAMAATSVLANNLAEARRRARVSQDDAAMAAHVSRQTLSKWENGREEPSLHDLVLLTSLYGTSLDRVLGLIDVDREHLLDLYEFSTPSNRRKLLRAAEQIQADKLDLADSDTAAALDAMRKKLDVLMAAATPEEQQFMEEMCRQLHGESQT